MKLLLFVLALLLVACSAPPGPEGPAGPPGPQGVPGSCSCPALASLFERVISLDAAADLSGVDQTEVVLEKVPAAAWPIGGRVAALWIDPATVDQMGLSTSQLMMDVGFPDEPGALASMVELSAPTPTIKEREGASLWPSGGRALDAPLVVSVYSDHLPLGGAVGHVDIHLVVAVPAPF